MMDIEVALEALGVLCNATVTSVQRHGVGLQAAGISGASLPSLMTVNHLVHRVLDGDVFRPVQGDFSAGILSPDELVTPVRRLSVDTDEDSKGGAGILSPDELVIQVRKMPVDTDEDSKGGSGILITQELVTPVRRLSVDTVEDSGGAVILSPQESGSLHTGFTIDTDKDSRGNLQLVVDEDEFFDPRYDYDFTKITDHQTFYRGGEKYERPCGWTRFALKVLGKYDKDTWLGNRWRKTRSVAGEWPVSYHGTSQKGAEGIIPGNYDMKEAKREKYGRGVYSTPYFSVAEGYAKKFRSKKTGKQYKVVLQNRINPEYREICKKNDKYWLVRIPKGTSDEEEKEMVDRAIRPYGLLLKEI